MSQLALERPRQPALARTATPVAASAARAVVRVSASIREIGQARWDECFQGELEGYGYLLAVEEAGLKDYSFRYFSVVEGGRAIACMPAFHARYNLATTLDAGRLKRGIESVQRRFPNVMRPPLGCIGSPETECAKVGFHPCVSERRREPLLIDLARAFESDARGKGCELLGVKDAPAHRHSAWNTVAAQLNYTALPGMDSAYLDVDFSSIEDYLGRFSPAARKDMRRKLKSRSLFRVEWRTSADDVIGEVYALYGMTKARCDYHLVDLTGDYFTGVLRNMPGRSAVALYYLEDKLMAANLVLFGHDTLLDKFFCMSGEEGRAHNLYFVSWFENLQYCLDNGLKHYRSGQSSYGVKLKMKSKLDPSALLFKHRSWAVNKCFQALSPLFALGNGEENA